MKMKKVWSLLLFAAVLSMGSCSKEHEPAAPVLE